MSNLQQDGLPGSWIAVHVTHVSLAVWKFRATRWLSRPCRAVCELVASGERLSQPTLRDFSRRTGSTQRCCSRSPRCCPSPLRTAVSSLLVDRAGYHRESLTGEAWLTLERVAGGKVYHAGMAQGRLHWTQGEQALVSGSGVNYEGQFFRLPVEKIGGRGPKEFELLRRRASHEWARSDRIVTHPPGRWEGASRDDVCLRRQRLLPSSERRPCRPRLRTIFR